MTGGILLALAGVWVGCQVFGGDALGRLGIITPSTGAGSGSSSNAGPATIAGDAAQAAQSAASSVAQDITGQSATITKPPLHPVTGVGAVGNPVVGG